MDQFQPISDNSDLLSKASLFRERAAEYRRRAENEELGHSIRESYRQLVPFYEALAGEPQGGAATRRVWEQLGLPESSTT